MEITAPVPSHVVPCANRHLDAICQRLSNEDVEQYQAFSGNEFDPDDFARSLVLSGGAQMAVLDESEQPVAACGYQGVGHGVWQFWMVCSSAGWVNDRTRVEEAMQWAIGGLFEIGARRVQTNMLASRAGMRKWYEDALGMTQEGVWRRAGANGEDIACLARLRKEH